MGYPKRMRLSVFVVALAAVLSLAAAAEAADYWVGPGGSNGNNGLTPGTAWATLVFAADQVGPGDTVHVLPGSYQGFYLDMSGTAGNPITFVADGPGVLEEGEGIAPRGKPRPTPGILVDPAVRRRELRPRVSRHEGPTDREVEGRVARDQVAPVDDARDLHGFGIDEDVLGGEVTVQEAGVSASEGVCVRVERSSRSVEVARGQALCAFHECDGVDRGLPHGFGPG